MKVSPDGRHLALAERNGPSELYDFNNATGAVSNYVPLQAFDFNYGIEFSPDNSRLYISLSLLGQVVQYNLLAGSTIAIQASARTIGTSKRMGSLQLGPDNKIYIATYASNALDVITNPNALGTACGYHIDAVPLGGKIGLNGLPNMPNAFAPITLTASFTSNAGCVGAAVAFTGTVQPVLSGTTVTWNFGDAASGAANTATGLTPTHTYTSAGTYQVTFTATHPSLATPVVSTQAVTVAALPTVQLGPDTLVCSNAAWVLRTNPQPAGTLYRWQDGSTAPTYLAHGPGQYSVEVRTSAAGCAATATRVATGKNCPIIVAPVAIPNIITPNGDPQNEFFTLKGLTPSEWHLSVFDRWGRQVFDQARYDNRWNATGQAAGLYYYTLSNAATGEHYRGWVEVMRGS